MPCALHVIIKSILYPRRTVNERGTLVHDIRTDSVVKAPETERAGSMLLNFFEIVYFV